MNNIYFYKISSLVAGVGKALRQAEQEQRRGQPPRHAEPDRDPARIAEHIMNVVQDHQRQGYPFQSRAAEPSCSCLLHRCSFLLRLFCIIRLVYYYNNTPIGKSQAKKAPRPILRPDAGEKKEGGVLSAQAMLWFLERRTNSVPTISTMPMGRPRRPGAPTLTRMPAMR